MKFSQETITPFVAEQILAKNFDRPRKIRAARVAEHARAMEAGEWDEQSPESIKIADDGTLLDGQHRLSAVVKHGGPIKFTVCRGVDKSAYQYLDSGIPRTLADRIHLSDRFTPTRHKTCVGIIQQWIRYEEVKRSVIAPAQAIEFFSKHRNALLWVLALYRTERGIGRLQAAVALCQMYERDPNKAVAMARGYYHNTMQVPNAITMREMMKGIVRDAVKGIADFGGSTQRDLLGRCITLCKAELAGKNIKTRSEKIKPSRWDD